MSIGVYMKIIVAEHIKELMRSEKLTQTDFANAIGGTR